MCQGVIRLQPGNKQHEDVCRNDTYPSSNGDCSRSRRVHPEAVCVLTPDRCG